MPPDWRPELRQLARLGLPTALLFALRTAQLLTDQAVVGHLRDTQTGQPTALYLDAVSQALLWMNLTSQCMIRGIGGAINTLAANALGAGNRTLAGVWLQVGLLVSTAAALLVGALWLLAAPALAQLVAQGGGDSHDSGGGGDEPSPEAVESLATEYARLSAFWLLPLFWMEALNTWLTAQQLVLPQLCVYAAFFLVNLGANVVLVHGLPGDAWGGLGFRGSPLATTGTRVLQGLTLLLLVRARGPALPAARAWREALRPSRLRTFVAQAAPRVLSAALEELCLGAVGLLAARLGAVAMATHNSMLMAFFWLTSPMYGLTTAAVVRIGRHLGAGDVAAAKGVARITVGIACTLGLAIGATLALARDEIGYVFSQDGAVVAMIGKIAPLTGGAYTLIGLFYSSMAVLNGQGRPLPVALSFLCGAFVVAPVGGYVLAFVADCCDGLRLYGLWFGLIAGYALTTAISGGAAVWSDWPRLAKAAAARSEVAAAGGAGGVVDDECGRAAGGSGEVGAGAEDAGRVQGDGAGGGVGRSGGATSDGMSQPLLPADTATSVNGATR